MRVRDHLLLSTLAAAALYPLLGRKTLAPWAASVLIDVDHYAWFCIERHTLSLPAAVRFFNQAQPPQHASTRRLHNPDALLALAVASIWWRPLRLPLSGLLFHIALDALHGARLDAVRRLALERDQHTCQSCGEHDATVVAHVWRQPPLLPSYHPDTLMSLCGLCHEVAHKVGPRFSQQVFSQSVRRLTPSEPVKELARES